MGQRGVLSPELEPDVDLGGADALTVSADDADDVVVSCGMLEEDSTRCMATAEGELLEPRFGLTSVLWSRERRPALGLVVPGGAAVR
jgi:hypothetical protein